MEVVIFASLAGRLLVVLDLIYSAEFKFRTVESVNKYRCFMIDNERDRFKYGYDAGLIIDGEVVLDEDGDISIVDEDGLCLSIKGHLKTLVGKKVRLTVISTDAIQMIEDMLANCNSDGG